MTLILLAFLGFAQPVSTQEGRESSFEKQSITQKKTDKVVSDAVDIRSDNLVVYQKKHQAVFFGNVRAAQDNLIIQSEKLIVSYARDRGSDTGASGIERMVFIGSVSIQQSKRQGYCVRAEYDRLAGRLVCIGRPWVVEGKNRIRGDRIEYLLEEDEVRVTHPQAKIYLPDREEKSR